MLQLIKKSIINLSFDMLKYSYFSLVEAGLIKPYNFTSDFFISFYFEC